MPYVEIVLCLALIQFQYLGFQVGRARVKYNCPAPATTGNELFERQLRVQMNTLEQLVVFVPGIVLFAYLVDARWATGLGLLFLVGRVVYARSYLRDPKTRSLGFGLTMLPNTVFVIGILVGAIRNTLP